MLNYKLSGIFCTAVHTNQALEFCMYLLHIKHMEQGFLNPFYISL